MVTGWACAGVLLLVLLTGSSYSYPAIKGFRAGSAYGSSNSANPAGSGWEGHASGFTDSSGRAAADKTASNPAPVAVDDSYPGSGRAGYSGYSAGPAQQQASTQDINWLVAPPGPFTPEERPSALRFAATKPDALGSTYLGPPAPPQFQAGELSHAETTFENGDYESETEEEGIPPPPPRVAAADGPVPNGELASVPGGGWVVYPYPTDHMFQRRLFPQGTLSHFTHSFEKGRDSWHDTHNLKYYPANPQYNTGWDSQPVKQFSGGYGQSGTVSRHRQPYRRVRPSRMTWVKHGEV